MNHRFLEPAPERGMDRGERWGWLVAGGLLTAAGVKRLAFDHALGSGIPLSGAGGYLLFRAARRERPGRELAMLKSPRSIFVERGVTIDKPADEIYRAWRNLADMPRFFPHIESVEIRDNRRSHWTMRGPAGTRLQWDSEIIDEREGELLMWRSVPGALLASSGELRLCKAPGDRGTEVHLRLAYSVAGSSTTTGVAGVFGRSPEQMAREGLRRFKQWLEAGEIATIEGQPHGRRSMKAKATKVFDPNPARRRHELMPPAWQTGTV